MSDQSQNIEDQDNSELVKPSLDKIIEDNSLDKILEDNSLDKILEDDSIDNSTKTKIVKRVIRSIAFSGPIPPPEIIAGYEKILPGSADRILSLTEKQAEHRRQIEKTLLKTDTLRTYLGLGAGFIIAIVGLGGAIYLGSQGRTVSSSILSGATITGLVTVFVKGGEQRKSQIEKDEEDG